MAVSGDDFEPFMAIPSFLSGWPLLHDQVNTATSQLQDKTIGECLPLLTAINNPASDPFDFDEQGLPYLQRQKHVAFILEGLEELPSAFVTMDASRPWLMYWSLTSLYIMKQNIEVFRSRIVKTFRPLQSQSGGFGGGQGHLPHLAGTYAILLTIALVGGEDVYGLVHRKAMWHWLGQLKQLDGGFRVCEDGEEDVRGAYCALVAITLLDLPWQLPDDAPARQCGHTDFRDGLGEYLSTCQTYEGGISASPGSEAHGAYTFCALACLCILGSPNRTIPTYLNVDALVEWLSARQYAPEGGFAGRTNKVVDGCYSHWIGGCWPLVEAALEGPTNQRSSRYPSNARIFDEEGLERYILGCCQGPQGGLRDKPSKRSDAYHTCYNLAGLRMACYRDRYAVQPQPNSTTLSWNSTSSTDLPPSFDDGGTIVAYASSFNPVYVIPDAALMFERNQTVSSSGPLRQAHIRSNHRPISNACKYSIGGMLTSDAHEITTGVTG